MFRKIIFIIHNRFVIFLALAFNYGQMVDYRYKLKKNKKNQNFAEHPECIRWSKTFLPLDLYLPLRAPSSFLRFNSIFYSTSSSCFGNFVPCWSSFKFVPRHLLIHLHAFRCSPLCLSDAWPYKLTVNVDIYVKMKSSTIINWIKRHHVKITKLKTIQ